MIKAFADATGCLPELYSKSLLLNLPDTLTSRCGKTKPDLTRINNSLSLPLPPPLSAG